MTMAIIQLAILFVLFVMAAFLSVAETALIGMSRIKIMAFIKNNHPKAKYLTEWIKAPNKLLATLSILINAVAVGSSTIAAFLSMEISEHFGLNGPFVATVVAIFVGGIIMVFGEITPKIFAIHNTEKMGLLLVGPVVTIYKIIRPITEFFTKISNFTVKLFGGKPADSIPVISAKDISTVIDVGLEEGFISEQEKAMMASILDFKNLQVRHIMVPRTEMVALDITWDTDKIIDVIIEQGYSRMPVYKDHYDNIVGIVYTKDMLSMIKNRGLIIFHDLIRIPYFVPATKNVNELFKEFKRGKIHMAIAVDEFGGTAGLITLEDILEEIVGEIQDEYDMESKAAETVDSNTFIVRGSAEISKINEQYKTDIPEEKDITTIGGFLMDLFAHVPKEGETITFGNLTFLILKSDLRRILKVKVTRKPEQK